MIVSSGKARPIAMSESSHRQLLVGTTRTEFRGGSGDGGKAATRSGRNGFPIWMRTVTRTHIALTSSRPGHTGVSPQCTHDRGLAPHGRRTPIVGASALHGVSGVAPGSHLGSTLRSGRAVLTRGVPRR